MQKQICSLSYEHFMLKHLSFLQIRENYKSFLPQKFYVYGMGSLWDLITCVIQILTAKLILKPTIISTMYN